MLEQYRSIKRNHQNEVLFFRLGDFYEMFCEDALEVSSLLNLTLTSRNGQPMCGIPYHAARAYIARLLRYGKKIAVCEQISAPSKGKGVLDREVVEIITPGTTVEEDFLDRGSSNYLAAFAQSANGYSFSYIDLSTGDFFATSFAVEEGVDKLRQELERLQIRELIIQESLLTAQSQFAQAVVSRPALVLNRWADWLFDQGRSRERLARQFAGAALSSFGLREDSPELISAGALLDYLEETAKSLIPHVRAIVLYGDEEYVSLDESSQRNLELIRNLKDGDSRFTLLEVLDETKTAMGKRLLKRRILHPLRDCTAIRSRLDMVETLYVDQSSLSSIRATLGSAPDLERLCSRLAMDRAHGKDMLSLKNILGNFQGLAQGIAHLRLVFESPEIGLLSDSALASLAELHALLERSIAEDPSITLTEGNLIKDGFNQSLDDFRDLRVNGRKRLEGYLAEEREKTGIPSLKIRYNRLIGYYIEVTTVHLPKVPEHFIRRQGIAQGERFTTDALAALESDINSAYEQIIELEKKLFLEIRNSAKELLPLLSAVAKWIAELDVAQSLARATTIRGWVRPTVQDGSSLRILEGRHPVVEANLPPGEFIPNDCCLDCGGISFSLITGPNMAGKSTYLRQAALIVIMAQMGSFVPAREADIGLVDRIYCRVGSTDNLARGESTFFLEMSETAYILRTATANSFILMDEVGRGTSAHDGLSIAWAVCEELLTAIQCRALFATHYHELAGLSHPHLAHFSMDIQEQGGEVIFLRQLQPGASAKSYGIHVARLAGLPHRVLERASEIMAGLGEKGLLGDGKPAESRSSEKAAMGEPDGARSAWQPILEELETLDPNSLTPLEALQRLYSWKDALRGKPQKAKKQREPPAPTLFDD